MQMAVGPMFSMDRCKATALAGNGQMFHQGKHEALGLWCCKYRARIISWRPREQVGLAEATGHGKELKMARAFFASWKASLEQMLILPVQPHLLHRLHVLRIWNFSSQIKKPPEIIYPEGLI
jgi:hypothetical protein